MSRILSFATESEVDYLTKTNNKGNSQSSESISHPTVMQESKSSQCLTESGPTIKRSDDNNTQKTWKNNFPTLAAQKASRKKHKSTATNV